MHYKYLDFSSWEHLEDDALQVVVVVAVLVSLRMLFVVEGGYHNQPHEQEQGGAKFEGGFWKGWEGEYF